MITESFLFLSLLLTCTAHVSSVGYDPEYRPSGLATYTPPSSFNFDVSLFTQWVWSQVALGVYEVAVAYGTWPVFPSDIPGSNYPLWFRNLNHFTMWFDNVTLVFQDYKKAGFSFDSCTNVTLRGVTTIYSEPTFSQALVTNITVSPTDNQTLWVDVEICKGYPNRFMLNQNSIAGYIFNGTTRLPYEPSKWIEVSFLSTSQNLTNDGSRLRFFMSSGYVTTGSLNIGDYITARGYFTQFFYAYNSSLLSYIDVTILNCGGFGFFAYAGDGGHLYRRVRITYAPPPVNGGTPPLITCSADGLHYMAIKQGPTIQNSLFEGTQDDAITIHGIMAKVTNVYGARQFRIKTGYDSYTYSVGDILRIYTASYVPRGYAYVSAVHINTDWSLNVILTGAIANSIQVNDIVADVSDQGNGFLIENSLIRWNRARGMLIKASNGIIRNNIVNGSSIGGIHITPEPDYESDYSQNIIIEGNFVSDCNFYHGWGSISIFMYYTGAHQYPVAGGFVNILINNNTILRSYMDNIFITSTLNLTITNNRIVGPLYRPVVYLTNIDNVTLIDNIVYQANPRDTTLLQMSSVTNPHGNITAGVYFDQNSPVPVLPDWTGFLVASTSVQQSGISSFAADKE
jgi:hypothetical protein